MARFGESRRNCPSCIGGLCTRASASTNPRAADRRAGSADDCARTNYCARADHGGCADDRARADDCANRSARVQWTEFLRARLQLYR